MRTQDALHFALMGLALALAYVLPVELLLLSYAILGPAHYATEISWLHDRRYFMPSTALAWGLGFAGVAAAFLVSPSLFGLAVCTIFVVFISLGTTKNPRTRNLVLLLGCVAIACIASLPGGLAWAGVLMPTIIHVSGFTLVFMILGAVKSRKPVQAGLVIAYLGGILAILVFPPGKETMIPSLAEAGQVFFADVPKAIAAVLHVDEVSLTGRLPGLLSFAYTYHYLNWFLKTDVISWHKMSAKRFGIVGAVSLGSTLLYFIDFRTGFVILLSLSILHVFLEFPLNGIAMRDLGKAAIGRLGLSSRSAKA